MFVVIPVYNRRDVTRTCLESLRRQSFRKFETIVFDDGSTDDTAAMVAREFPEVILLRGPGNYWWSRSVNEAIQCAMDREARTVILLNDDVVLPSDYIEELMRASAAHPEALIGSSGWDIRTKRAVYCAVNYNWVLARARYLAVPGEGEIHPPYVCSSDFLFGRGLLVPAFVFDRIGLLDYRRFPQSIADCDFTHRAKTNGFPLFCSLKARVFYSVDATGISGLIGTKSLVNFSRFLFSKSSSDNIVHRIRFLVKNTQPHVSLVAIPIFVGRAVLSYWLKPRWSTGLLKRNCEPAEH